MQLQAINFVDLSPSLWGMALDRASQADLLDVPIYWGAHETTLGVRDFGQTSTRNLERFLALCVKKNIKVRARLGFPPHARTFPRWVEGLGQNALVPRTFWEQAPDDFALTHCPSLRQSRLQKGFLDFFSETLSILSLYVGPDGCVETIYLDFGIYETDLSVIESDQLTRLLQLRYHSIDQLNKMYGTRFTDFEAIATDRAMEVLLNRRAWMAAFDYRWCRTQGLLALWEQAIKVSEQLDLKSYVTSSLHGQIPASASLKSGWQIAYDPTFLETAGDRTYPLCPEGIIHRSAVQSFRLWECLKKNASHSNVKALLLPFWEDRMPFSTELLAVFCGKYLTRASFGSIEKYFEAGGKAYFPFGLPQYDEQMKNRSWGDVPFKPVEQSGEKFLCFNIRNGQAYVPARTLTFSDSLWDSVSQQIACLEQKGNCS